MSGQAADEVAIVTLGLEDMQRYREHGTGRIVYAWQAPGPSSVAMSVKSGTIALKLKLVPAGSWVVLQNPGHLACLTHRNFAGTYQGLLS